MRATREGANEVASSSFPATLSQLFVRMAHHKFRSMDQDSATASAARSAILEIHERETIETSGRKP